MLHDDAAKLGPTWQDFTPPVVDLTERDLIADMWSYSMAAAHHNLPHTQIETYMVSNPYGNDEGFPFVTAAIKRNPKMSCHNPPPITDGPGPTLLHFCQNLHTKDGRGRTWMFHKVRPVVTDFVLRALGCSDFLVPFIGFELGRATNVVIVTAAIFFRVTFPSTSWSATFPC